MADRKIYIEVEFDDKGAKARLIELDRLADELGQTAGGRATQGVSFLQAALSRATGSGTAAATAVNGVHSAATRATSSAAAMAQTVSGSTVPAVVSLNSALTNSIITGNLVAETFSKLSSQFVDIVRDSTVLAARVEALGGVARFMGEQMGHSGVAIDKMAKGLQAQGITTRASYEGLIRLSQANIDLSKSTALAAVAQNSARITGENSSATLDKLIHGVTTLQPEVLRTAGIVVNLELAYKKWATAQGRATESLSGTEKQQIALNAVLEQGERIAGVYGKTNEFVSGRLQSLARHQEEASLAIGQRFIPAMILAIDVQTEFFKWIKQSPDAVIDFGGALVTLISTLAGLRILTSVIGWLGGTAGIMTVLTTGIVGPAGLIIALGLLITGLGRLTIELGHSGQAADGWGNRLKEAFARPLTSVTDLVEVFNALREGKSVGEIIDTLRKASEQADRPVTSLAVATAMLNKEMQNTLLIAKDPDWSKFLAPFGKAAESGFATAALTDTQELMKQRAAALKASVKDTSDASEANRIYARTLANIGTELKSAIQNMEATGKDAKTVAAEFGVSEDIVKRYKKAIEEAAKATSEAGKAMREANKAIAEARASWVALTPAQAAAIDSYNALGVANEHIATKLHLSRAAVDRYLETVEFIKKANHDLAASHQVTWADFTALVEKDTKRIADAIITNAKVGADAQRELNEMMREDTMSRLEFELDAIIRTGDNLKLQLDKTAANYQSQADVIDELTGQKLARYITGTKEVTAALSVLSMLMPGLTVKLHEFNEELDGAGKMTKWQGITEGLLGVIKGLPDLLVDAFTGGGGMAGALKALGVQIAQAIAQPIVETLSKVQNAAISVGAGIAGALGGALGGKGVGMAGSIASGLGGAMVAASGLGASLAKAGVMGALGMGAITLGIGAAVVGVGLLIKKFGMVPEEVKKAREELVSFQAELAKTLTATQKQEAGNEQWKMDLIAVRDAYLRVGRTAQEAEAITRQMWNTDDPEKSRAAMKEIAKVFEEVAQRAEHVKTVMSSALAIIAGSQSAFEQWAAIGDAVEKARESGEGLTEALTNQFHAAEAAKQELADLGTIAMGAFAVAMAEGATFAEALAAAQSGLQQISQAYKDLGLNIEDAGLRALVMQSDMLAKNPALIQGASALGQQLQALGAINMLNAETFRAVERTAQTMFTRIQGEVAALGGDTRDALLPMQDFLRRAAAEAKALGIPLDENTQRMIDQSKELGIWKELGPTAAEKNTMAIERMTQAVERMTRALLGIPEELPDPFANWKPPLETGPGTVPEEPGGGNPFEPQSLNSNAITGGGFTLASAALTPSNRISTGQRSRLPAGAVGVAPVVTNKVAVVVVKGGEGQDERILAAVREAMAEEFPGQFRRNEGEMQTEVIDLVAGALRNAPRSS